MSMKQETERAFTVTFTASAVVSFSIEVEAIDSDAAEEFAREELEGLTPHFTRIIDELMSVNDAALVGYCEVAKPPVTITHASVAYHRDDEFDIDAEEA